MSDTKVDMPKVCQMIDAGWIVQIFKNDLGSYTAMARHGNPDVQVKAESALRDAILNDPNAIDEMDYELAELTAEMDTDDFTPEQALTRLAYKVHGEVI